MTTVAPAPARSTLPLLFARYVAGHIAQAQWDAFSMAFDDLDAPADVRDAFARFYLEAATDGLEVKLPRSNELDDLVGLVR